MAVKWWTAEGGEGVTSSCLCKKIEGMVLPLLVERAENCKKQEGFLAALGMTGSVGLIG